MKHRHAYLGGNIYKSKFTWPVIISDDEILLKIEKEIEKGTEENGNIDEEIEENPEISEEISDIEEIDNGKMSENEMQIVENTNKPVLKLKILKK